MKNNFLIKKGTRDLNLKFKNKILPNSKHSQVGTTITWMVAFVVVFFVIVLFVGTSVLLISQKQFTKNEIQSSGTNFDNMNYQYELTNFLNTNVEFHGEKMNFEQLIVKTYSSSDASEVETKINDYFSKIGMDCYVFGAGDRENFLVSSKTNGDGCKIENGLDLRSVKRVSVDIIVNGKKINAGFY